MSDTLAKQVKNTESLQVVFDALNQYQNSVNVHNSDAVSPRDNDIKLLTDISDLSTKLKYASLKQLHGNNVY